MKQIITIKDFEPRWYQREVLSVWNPDNPNRKNRYLLCWARRTGKDYLAWHIAIWECLRKRQIVYYIFPTFQMARSVIWSSLTIDGKPFRSFIPPAALYKINEARMEVHFTNGSILSLKGSNNPDSMRGANCSIAIFSEYADQDPATWQLVINPVLRANNGTAFFLSTPKGRNAFYQLYELSKNDDRWYSDLKTVEDAGHIDIEDIKQDIARGIISEDQARQEFWCDFNRGRAGQIFGNELARTRLDERITYVPYQDGQLVHTAMDLGWNDEFCIIFFQVIGHVVNVIDCYADRQKSLAHYAQIIHDKSYTYGTHFAPHDARQHSLQTGITREDKLADLGVPVEILPRKRIIDRIEDGRCLFAKAWIDEKRCEPLLKSLEHYHRQWNDTLQRYNDTPNHDWSSHFADCWTYMAVAVKEHKFGISMTTDDINELKRKARHADSPFDVPRLTNPNLF